MNRLNNMLPEFVQEPIFKDLLEIEGAEIFKIENELFQIKNQLTVTYADIALSRWEWIYGLKNGSYLDIEYRKKRLYSKIRQTVGIVNAFKIKSIIESYGFKVNVTEEYPNEYRIKIVFETDAGEDILELLGFLRKFIPAHILIEAGIIIEIRSNLIYIDGFIGLDAGKIKITTKTVNNMNFNKAIYLGSSCLDISSFFIPTKFKE